MTDTTDTARTTWPTAQPLQQAADSRRAAGDPLMADWLDATANALAWLAPYRDTEPGYAMWEAALVVARQVLGTTTGQPETAPWPPVSGERPDHELYTLLRKYGLDPDAAQQVIATYTRTILTGQTAPTVTRAEVLREAADRFERECPGAAGPMDLCMCHAAEPLREWADEAQQPIPAPAEETK